MNICSIALILISSVSITSTDIPHENQRLIFSKQWMDLFVRTGGSTEKVGLSKRALNMINPYASELTGDEAQQLEAAIKIFSTLGRQPQFAGIARLMLEDDAEKEEEERVLKTLEYVMMKKGVGTGYSKFVRDKVESIDKEMKINLGAVKEALGGNHPMQQLFEKFSSHYVKQQYKLQFEVTNKFKQLKEMMDKFKTANEYLAANGFK